MSYNSIPKYNNVWELFTKCTELYENKEFFSFNRGLAKVVTTYGEEFIRTKKVARYLVDIGLKKGDKLVLYFPTSAYWVELFYACALLGVIAIPIDMDTPEEVIKKILEETKPKYIFDSEKKRIEKSNDNVVIEIEQLDKNIHNLEPIKTREYVKEIQPDDPMEIIYTSGTTGKPKGVQISNKNIVTNVYNVLLVFPIKDQLNLMQLLPLSHSYAQILTFGVTVIGGKIFFLDRISGDNIKKTLKNNYINALPVVPQVLITIKEGIENKFRKVKLLFVLNLLQKISGAVKNQKFSRILFKFVHKELGGNLDLVASAGAALPPDVFTWWENLGMNVYKGYGATETGPVLTFEIKEDPDPFSVGKPIPNQMFKIDENGEILTKGDHVTIGYFQNPEENAKAFTEDGWYKTGDKGYMENGLVFLKGRIKDMIVLANGVNIFPNDIEHAFNKIHEIEDSVVLGIDFGRGAELTAVFKTKAIKEQLEGIVYKVNNKLTKNQWIKHFLVWPEEDFPRTHTKKIKRPLVLERVQKILFEKEEQKKNAVGTMSEDNVENTVRQILADVTGKDISEITPEANLAGDLFLDSLGRADLIATVALKLNKQIDETKIESSTTFSDLVEITKNSPVFTGFKPVHLSNGLVNPVLIWVREFLIFPILRFVFSFFFKITTIGEIEKSDSPKIIIGNHRANFDALLFFFTLPRELRMKTVILMAGDIWNKRKYYIGKKLIQTGVPAYTIDRRYDANAALEIAAYFLNNGYNVLLFPEGEIVYDYKTKGIHFKRGAAKLIKDFRLPLVEFKSKGLDVVPKGKFFPEPKRFPITMEIFNKIQDPFKSIDEITADIEKDFIGY